MSIHDLMEKINPFGSPGSSIDQSLVISSKRVVLSTSLIALSVVLGISAVAGSIYVITKLETPQPVQIVCSDEVKQALEATSTPIKAPKVPKATSIGKPPKVTKQKLPKKAKKPTQEQGTYQSKKIEKPFQN